MPRRHSGFTLAELLVVLVIAALLAATFIPWAMHLRELDNRTRCVNNLRQIRDGLQQYVHASGRFPSTAFDPELPEWTAFTGVDGDPRPNDVTAPLWLLAREGLISNVDVFHCPSSPGRGDPMLDAAGRPTTAAARGNFRHPNYLTYDVAYPYPVEAAGYKLDANMPARFVLMADRGPAEIGSSNSPNHAGQGQYVLYGDGSVQWLADPFAGVGREQTALGDHIYSALSRTPLAAPARHDAVGVFDRRVTPAYNFDSMLVPQGGDLPQSGFNH